MICVLSCLVPFLEHHDGEIHGTPVDWYLHCGPGRTEVVCEPRKVPLQRRPGESSQHMKQFRVCHYGRKAGAGYYV